ncbi:unnamed protein product [Lactuca saligna]|uniref:Uncharacterized protein n=1 Tax=Lactuca saligna TaxID=75948 RepID=A0AA35ZXK2_LACSI|nr:unnamed protein product [Lactuca saligna]
MDVTLQVEKEYLSPVCSEIKANSDALNAYVVSRMRNFRQTLLQKTILWTNLPKRLKQELSEGEKLIGKKRDVELENLLRVRKELEAKVTLATQKSHFTPWTLERIQKEATDEPSTNWLEPSVFYELDNIAESQPDFPITPRAFLFKCFEKISKAHLSDSDVNQTLLSFYLKYGKPQFQTWCLQKIIAVRVYASISTEILINIKFKGFKGANRTEMEFTLANLPCMNPYDWISLFLILSKYEQK